MKSSIKIDFLDRGTGKGIEPVIRIESISSEDPRDTLIQTLLQSVSGSYLQLAYAPTDATYNPKAESHNRVLVFKPDGFNVRDNSNGFRKFLDEKGIKWKPNEHFTTILDENIDLYHMGRNVEKYKAEHPEG